LHAEVGRYAVQAGIDVLLACGEYTRASVEAFGAGGRFFEDGAALVAALQAQLGAHSVVLFKGSRMMRMETLVAELQQAMQKHAARAQGGDGCC